MDTPKAVEWSIDWGVCSATFDSYDDAMLVQSQQPTPDGVDRDYWDVELVGPGRWRVRVHADLLNNYLGKRVPLTVRGGGRP